MGDSAIIHSFKDKRVMVIGDVMLDQYIHGITDRLNPEIPGVPLIRATSTNDYRLGGAANVAANISSLGPQCTLFGLCGNDEPGKALEKLCVKNNIEANLVTDSDSRTIVKQRIFSNGHYIARVDYGENEKNILTEDGLETTIIGKLNDFDLVVFSDYDKGIFEGDLARNVIDRAKAKGVLTLVDPKPQNFLSFYGCDVVRPNRKEAEEFSGRKKRNGLEEISKKIARELSAKFVVVTLGKKGASAYDARNREFNILPTKEVEIGDATGAGDTFASVLGLSMISGAEFQDAVKIANYASSMVVTKPGTSTISAEELDLYIHNF